MPTPKRQSPIDAGSGTGALLRKVSPMLPVVTCPNVPVPPKSSRAYHAVVLLVLYVELSKVGTNEVFMNWHRIVVAVFAPKLGLFVTLHCENAFASDSSGVPDFNGLFELELN